MFQIGTYETAPAIFAAYDPRTPEVAQLLASALQQRDPRLFIEHIGSTAVPGCRGKGIIDLAVTYLEGDLERAKAALDDLGFQRQAGRDPWPESRPMRVALVSAFGAYFQVHAHVIKWNCEEHRGLIAFRDALRSDPKLLSNYEELKQQILTSGITDSLDYSNAKHAFIFTATARLLNL